MLSVLRRDRRLGVELPRTNWGSALMPTGTREVHATRNGAITRGCGHRRPFPRERQNSRPAEGDWWVWSTKGEG